ncbi:hypothetical protein AB0N06_07705 [Streptomyces sp. NPDC051020]|uniref:hypothetical protein n=1 Tax=Streptomyces sp. NPDC051020 TaxID=3155409 RepID=UPI003448EB22
MKRRGASPTPRLPDGVAPVVPGRSVPKSAQPAAKKAIQDIYNAEDKEHATRAVKAFEKQYMRWMRSPIRTKPRPPPQRTGLFACG